MIAAARPSDKPIARGTHDDDRSGELGEEIRRSAGGCSNGVSFTAEAGKIFGLVRPQCQAKAPRLVVFQACSATAGRIRVLGHDVAVDGMAAKQILGVVPQELALYDDLSATENLSFWAGAYGSGPSESASRSRKCLRP